MFISLFHLFIFIKNFKPELLVFFLNFANHFIYCCYFTALMLIYFHLRKDRATFLQPETIFASDGVTLQSIYQSIVKLFPILQDIFTVKNHFIHWIKHLILFWKLILSSIKHNLFDDATQTEWIVLEQKCLRDSHYSL